MGITAELCEKIVATNWNDLSEEAIHRTRRIILDGIAVAVAGTIQEEAPEVLAKHVKKLGGTPDSTVINFRFKIGKCFIVRNFYISIKVGIDPN